MLFIFDMGGVVTNTFKMDSIYKKLNLEKSDFNNICRNGSRNIEQELNTGKIGSSEFWEEFNRRIESLKSGKIEGFEEVFQTENSEKFSLVPEVTTDLFRLCFHPSKNLETIELIQKLKKKHRVVCGTNTIQSHWENHMERGDYSFFNQTYPSNKIGCAKPDPHFFELILEAEETPANKSFFTDDKLENVKAAASLGINAELFTSAAELSEKWKPYC